MTALLEKPLLPAFLHGEPPQEAGGGFQIDDDRKAAWAASKILAARRRLALRTQMADAYQSRILDWLTQANEADQRSIAFLETSLRPWVETAVSHLGKTRSLALPGSKVGLRKLPDKVEVVDQDSALAFCLEFLDEVVVVKRDLSKTELKKHLVEGAQIPGVQLVQGIDVLTVSEDGKGEL
jgi:phage host-nuclease inhibitor protein Gam